MKVNINTPTILHINQPKIKFFERERKKNYIFNPELIHSISDSTQKYFLLINFLFSCRKKHFTLRHKGKYKYTYNLTNQPKIKLSRRDRKKCYIFNLELIHSSSDSTQKYPIIPCGVIMKCFRHIYIDTRYKNTR